MIVQIDSKKRIRGTNRCWQIERLQTKNGDPKWEPYKYYRTFQQALAKAGDDEIRLHPADNLTDAIDAVAAISHKYGEIFGVNLSDAEQHQAGIRQNLRGAA